MTTPNLRELFDLEHAPKTDAVVSVGGGCGFVVEIGGYRRLIITAAHCLPDLPRAFGPAFVEECTFRDLVGPLGHEQSIWAECLFVDPVSDVAVLGTPDYQELSDQSCAYNALVDLVDPFIVAETPAVFPVDVRVGEPALLFSPQGRWFPCRIEANPGGAIWVADAAEGIVGGMSGSPILLPDGKAIGVLCVSSGVGKQPHTEGGPNPNLSAHLSAGLWRALTTDSPQTPAL